jgi:hypothetical protein
LKAVLKIKKRHVERLTRLPTDRLATACWEAIVAKTNRPKMAPMLVSGPLRGANNENHPQVINKLREALEPGPAAGASTPERL